MFKPMIAIATAFSGRFIPPQWHLTMCSLQYPSNTSHINIATVGQHSDVAFDSLASMALQHGAKYTFFVDDDTQIPTTAILDLWKLLENSPEDVAVAGGIYTTRANPPIPLVFAEPYQGTFWNWRVGDIFPCWALGGGSMMIRTEVFSKMSKPWFKEIHSMEEARQHPEAFTEEELKGVGKIDVTVEMFFFRKLANMGLKVLAHGGVLPLHWSPEGKAFWIPADTLPTKGFKFKGEDFGWKPDRPPQLI